MIEERPLSASRSSSIETLDTPVSVFGLSLLSRNQNQGAYLFLGNTHCSRPSPRSVVCLSY